MRRSANNPRPNDARLSEGAKEKQKCSGNSDLTLTEQSVPGRGSSAAGARSCRGRLQVVRRGPWADSLRGRGVAAAASPGASWIRGVELLAGTKRAFGSRRSQRGIGQKLDESRGLHSFFSESVQLSEEPTIGLSIWYN